MAESLLSFLTKLVENTPQLLLLVFGTILFVLSGANQLPLGNLQIPLSSSVKVGLFLIGLLLIGCALWMLYGNEKFRRIKKVDTLEGEKSDLARRVESQEDSIKQKTVKIEELERVIDEALKVAQEKGVAEVSRILSKASQAIADAEEKFKPLTDAANWVNIKMDGWIKIIEPSGYKDYGVSDDNIEAFRKEILEHLKLLENNLREMIPDTIPRLCHVPQNVAKNSLAYSKALKVIQNQMGKDLK